MRKGITRLSKLRSKHAGQTDIPVSLTARIDSSFCAPRYVRHRVDINLVIFHFLYRIYLPIQPFSSAEYLINALNHGSLIELYFVKYLLRE
jgi:hypothetical protein